MARSSSFGRLVLAALWMAKALAQPQASVTGTVTDSVTGLPILRAHVNLRAGEKSFGAFSDAEGRTLSILAMAEDVTARVETLEQLQQAAVHDALTGLPNRNSLAARLEHAIRRVTRTGERLALLFIDLDRFKKVNDTLGHAAGDEVLRQSAARIRACVRDGDSLARLGGDEFVVLLENDVSPDVPGIIGERIRKAFESPFDWHGTDVRCGASIGVSLYPDHAGDPATLLASADEAMYRVKNAAE